MDLWHINTPGPGVSPNEPRKKGLRRFIELFFRDGKQYLLANLICLLCFLPGVVLVCFGVYSGSLPFTLLAGAVLGIPAGIALSGLYDTILRTLRDEAAFWWPTYRRAIRQDLKLSVPSGALFGATLAAMVFVIYWKQQTDPDAGAQSWAGIMLYCLLFTMLFTGLLPQLAVLDVSFGRLIKNSVFFMIGYLPRVALAAALELVYWGATAALFPYSTIFLPLLGFWFITLICCMIVYPPLDSTYHIEETLRQRAEQ